MLELKGLSHNDENVGHVKVYIYTCKLIINMSQELMFKTNNLIHMHTLCFIAGCPNLFSWSCKI